MSGWCLTKCQKQQRKSPVLTKAFFGKSPQAVLRNDALQYPTVQRYAQDSEARGHVPRESLRDNWNFS
jgi:hypothetical protein